MEEIVLQAKKRDVIGKQVKALRRQGGLPAILYGSIDPQPITLEAHAAERVLQSVTSSHLITVEVEGSPHAVLVRERQRDPLTGHLFHVDFQVVSLTERLRASVMLDLVGDAPAIKEQSGVLVTGLESLDVECLPQDLPERITVDLTSLVEVGDAIYVRDLPLPEAITVWNDLDDMVILVTAPEAEVLEEEEEEEAIEALEEEPEVIERGKREEEEEEES
jgi:large subunit ribosomal protein L25